jgi:hypothetical protein
LSFVPPEGIFDGRSCLGGIGPTRGYDFMRRAVGAASLISSLGCGAIFANRNKLIAAVVDVMMPRIRYGDA